MLDEPREIADELRRQIRSRLRLEVERRVEGTAVFLFAELGQCAFSRSISTRRRILPEADFGIWSMNSR